MRILVSADLPLQRLLRHKEETDTKGAAAGLVAPSCCACADKGNWRESCLTKVARGLSRNKYIQNMGYCYCLF